MATTTRYGFRYPVKGDTRIGPLDTQHLAEDVEAKIITLDTDGAAPTAASPNCGFLPGPGWILAQWTPISNADEVTYEVHMSRTAGFTPGSGTLCGTTRGNEYFIRTDPTLSNIPIVPGVQYYLEVRAKDKDGYAPRSAVQVSGFCDSSVILSRFTTAGRPASPSIGELHFNDTYGNPEVYNGSAYQQLLQVGTDFAIYEALRNLGATNLPLASTLDPTQIDNAAVHPLSAQRLAMGCITVPKTCVCTGFWIWIDVGQAQIAYAGAGLWQYNADGSATLLRNTTSQGPLYNAAGYRSSAWNGTAGGNITLQPGIVYLVGAHSNFSGTAPTARGRPGQAGNLNMGAGLHFRSGGVVSTTQTEAAIFKNYTQAQLGAFTNLPLMGVY
jgi:hypothetical protein